MAVEHADDGPAESFFSTPPAAVARENIAILSRTLWLHTVSVRSLDDGLFAVAVAFRREPSGSVSGSVLPPSSAGCTAATEYDDFMTAARSPPQPTRERSGVFGSDVRSSGRPAVVASHTCRSSVEKTNRCLY